MATVDEGTKLYLVKALIEGIPCEFDSVADMDEFSQSLIDEIDKNEYVHSSLSGDADGILVTCNNTLTPYATILFKSKRITFKMLMDENDIDVGTARDMARIVLNTLGLVRQRGCIFEKKENAEIKTFEFKPSEFGIIL